MKRCIKSVRIAEEEVMPTLIVLSLCICAGLAMHFYQVLTLLAWISRRTRSEAVQRAWALWSDTQAGAFGSAPPATGLPPDKLENPPPAHHSISQNVAC